MKSFLEFDQLDEVLSKDADAGKWIDDFVNSDDPKFAGKSKEKRKQMALAAYYGQQNEEVLDESAEHIEQHLADKDINSSVQGKTVKVHSSDVSAAKKHLAKAGYKDHKVVSGLNEGIVDKVRGANYKRLAKRSFDKAYDAHQDSIDAPKTPAERRSARAEFNKQYDKGVAREKLAKEVEKVTPVKESMDKMFKHVHPNVSDPKVAHKQAMDVVKGNQGKVRKISDTHSEVDFPGGKSAVFKTSKEGDKVVTHIAHHNTYSESVEQIDELSKGTLGSYIKKASEQGKKAAVGANQSGRGATDALSNGNSNLHDLHVDNYKYSKNLEKKRAAGISKAVDKLTKEETLDELSKDTLGSYVNKSFAQGNELHYDLAHMKGDKATDAERKAVRDKISKRNLGVIKANKKLKEENQMISYSEFMAKLDESSASEKAAEILAAKRAERLDKYDFSKEKQKPASAAKQVKGHSYGADKADDEDDEDVKKSSEPEVKRGRGRPAGSKSGARV